MDATTISPAKALSCAAGRFVGNLRALFLVMNVVPLIILFLVMQRQIVSGIQRGGVKG